ncbi:DUF5677 domain-containing protein [Pseudomonas luteola]
MTDKDNLNNQFLDYGFLSKDIQLGIDFIKDENKEWFSLLRKINHILQRMVIAGTDKHVGHTLEPKVLATFSGIRALGNLQAAVLTLERGMIAETRIMARCLFENSFCIGALAENPDVFIPMLRHDNQAAKQGQAKALKDGSYSLTSDVQAAIDEKLSNGVKVNHINWKKVAELSSLRNNYLYYRYLSDDAMHYSASSLNRHIVTDSEKKSWNGYRFGPGTKDEVSVTARYCAAASISIAVGYAQITEENDFSEELKSLAKEFSSLSSSDVSR